MYTKYDLENLSTVVRDIRGNDYEFKSYFYDDRHQLQLNILHKNCGNIFTVSAYNFLKKKTNCTKCSKNKKITHKEFVERVSKLTNREYIVIGQFESVSKKVKLQHISCGAEFEMLAENFLCGQRCPNCNPRKNRGEANFKKAFDIISNGDYQLLSNYKNSREKILVKHITCGYEYSVLANNFLRGHKCPKCFKGRHISEQSFKNKLNDLGFFNQHILLSNFVGTKKKIKVKHTICGTEFEIVAGHLYRFPEVCPKCKKSYGEKKIEEFLLKNNIIFESEKKFDNCKDKYKLPFDFYIESCKTLIEYDGEQHFKPVFGKKQFEATKLHDKIKNDFASAYNYNLIRISYIDFNNIEKILSSAFKL